MRNLINIKDLTWSQGLVEKLSGTHMFTVPAVLVASTVVTFARVTAFSQTALPELWYAIGALIISQLFAGIFLVSVRRVLPKISQPQQRADLVIAASLFSNVIWAVAMDLILARWQVPQIEYTQWQIFSGLIFSSLSIIVISLVAELIYENNELEQSANEKAKNLQSSKVKYVQRIKENRLFILRELALEVNVSRECLEGAVESKLLSESQVSELKSTLTQVEIVSQNIMKNYPLRSQLLQPLPQFVHNLKYVVASGDERKGLLPLALGIASLFGVSGWFKYSLESFAVFFYIATLSMVGFVSFWAFEKLLLPAFIRLADWFRILIFEFGLVVYLVFWVVTIGFIAGDGPFGYSLALASAVIPFLLLNATAFGVGLIVSSQKFRLELVDLAESLTTEIEKLVKISDSESHAWKNLFSSNLEYSPTTASMMMVEAEMIRDHTECLEVIRKVTIIWKSALNQLESVWHQPEMQRS